MRIVYLHQHYRTPAMSGGTRSYEFSRRLVERGHEVHLITSDARVGAGDDPGADGGWRVTTEAGVTVHWAAVPYHNTMGYRSRLGAFGRFARLAARRAATLDQDVVLASSTPLTVALPGAYSAWRRRVPMVLEVRDLWPTAPVALGALRSPAARRAAWRLEAWAYRRARHVIALSPDMADDIRRRFPGTPLTVIPNGSDVAEFAGAERAGADLRRTTPWLGDRPMVLYAGTLGLVNGVDYLVHLAAAVRDTDPELRIVIVGEGRERDRVVSLAQRLGVLGENLHLLPPESKARIAGYFAACDLAVSTVIDVPELAANSANKVFDGFAAGRPVAVNHGGWIAETIAGSGAGLVLPADDPGKAARLVSEFLADPQRVAQARCAAAGLGRGRFSRAAQFERFERVLVEAAGSAPAPDPAMTTEEFAES